MDWQKVADPKGRDTALNTKCTAPRNQHWTSTRKPAPPLFTDSSSPFNSFNAFSFLRRPARSEVTRGNSNQSEVVFLFWLYGSGRGLLHDIRRMVTSDRTSCSTIFSNRSSMLNSHSAPISLNLGWPVPSEVTRGLPRCMTDNPRRTRGNPSLQSRVHSPHSRPVPGRVCRTIAKCNQLQISANNYELWLQWIFFGGAVCSFANRTIATQLQLFAGRRRSTQGQLLPICILLLTATARRPGRYDVTAQPERDSQAQQR